MVVDILGGDFFRPFGAYDVGYQFSGGLRRPAMRSFGPLGPYIEPLRGSGVCGWVGHGFRFATPVVIYIEPLRGCGFLPSQE